jgi:inner membrane protein
MEQQPTFWQRYSAMFKMALVAILALVLLIPSMMIRGLINERKNNQQQVIDEVGSKWGREQIISGPIISVPFVLSTNNSNQAQTIEYAHFLPETFNVSGSLKTEFRYRSIFKVIGYRADLKINGKLTRPEISNFNRQTQAGMDLSSAIIQFPVSDLKGIKERVVLIVDGKSYEMNPGLTINDIGASGLWCKVNLDEMFAKGNTVNYEINLKKLDGTQRIGFLPVGKETQVSLQSNWASPKFDGNFLPETRAVSKRGFSASWKILNLNRNFPQQFSGSNSEVGQSQFWVSFIQPVDHYMLSERSAKYAILFIALTFLTFFFCEITNERKIHPIQYILIGLALVMFFTLLLSLSEQVGFDNAYLISATAIILMITMYAQSILKNLRISGIIGGILILLYGFIYIILQLENMALLFGSIGLFAILALVMYISRKIDWYQVGIKKQSTSD